MISLITGLTDEPKQEMTIAMSDGSKATLLIEYRPQQLGWFYNLSYGDFTCLGSRFVPSPNMVRQYVNQIPFGLLVVTKGNRELIYQKDFSDGTCQVYLLEGADIALVDQVFARP